MKAIYYLVLFVVALVASACKCNDAPAPPYRPVYLEATRMTPREPCGVNWDGPCRREYARAEERETPPSEWHRKGEELPPGTRFVVGGDLGRDGEKSIKLPPACAPQAPASPAAVITVPAPTRRYTRTIVLDRRVTKDPDGGESEARVETLKVDGDIDPSAKPDPVFRQ